MKKSMFLIVVFALALTIFSCETQNTGEADGADSTEGTDSTDVQAGVTFGDSGAPGGAADIWQNSLLD